MVYNLTIFTKWEAFSLSKGYIITIYGNSHEKQTVYTENEPSAEELKKLIIEHKGVKAFVTEGSLFAIND